MIVIRPNSSLLGLNASRQIMPNTAIDSRGMLTPCRSTIRRLNVNLLQSGTGRNNRLKLWPGRASSRSARVKAALLQKRQDFRVIIPLTRHTHSETHSLHPSSQYRSNRHQGHSQGQVRPVQAPSGGFRLEPDWARQEIQCS